jgi:hypothetical protein
MTKQEILRAIDELPEDASIDDAMDTLLLLAKIERARQQIEAGEVVSHEEAKLRISKWRR